MIVGHVGVNVISRDAGHRPVSNVFQKRRENRITLRRRRSVDDTAGRTDSDYVFHLVDSFLL